MKKLLLYIFTCSALTLMFPACYPVYPESEKVFVVDEDDIDMNGELYKDYKEYLERRKATQKTNRLNEHMRKWYMDFQIINKRKPSINEMIKEAESF